MKRNKFLLQITFLILLLSTAACKKYGYEVEDGYTDGSKTPNTSSSIDTNMSVVDRTMYAKARIFPGLVDNSEPRVKDQKFTLDLNFSAQNASNLRIQVAPEPQFSTGYYAAPGELIKIIVPDGINGLSMQIGGHTDNLTGKVPLLRDPIIYSVKQLYPGVNYVRNLYGGTIYIRAAFAFPKPVEFTISGAVVSPDFVLGVTQDAAWVAQVKASNVPWLEMRAKRVVFLIPRDFVIRKFTSSEPLTNPTAVMTEWNNKFDLDYNAWMGLSDNAPDVKDRSPQGPWRGVLDIQLTAGYGHSGFPFVGQMDDEWFNSFTSLKQLLTGTNWGTYHEFGHNCQQPLVWSWSTLGETTNNLFSFKVAKRNGVAFNILHGVNHDYVTAALAFAASTPAAGVTKNFDTDPLFVDVNEGPFRKINPFIQLFEKYGYDMMTYFYTSARHASRLSFNDIDKHDFTYERASEYAQTDLAAFFEAWGILISTQSQAKISAKYPPLKVKLWTYNIFTKAGGTAAIVPTMTASSEETNGEGAVNGRAATLLDGNTATYWHSAWQTAPIGAFPYTLTYNLGYSQTLRGLYFTPRASAGQRPKNVDILSSADNVTFTAVASTQIPNAATQYNFIFPAPVKAKYYRIVIKDSWNTGTNASLSEVGAIQ
ncbi:M60 family metallopeptidase [Pedobacter punctiformis]|uniref:M60 family metallopeptidase n=1 Tax=Pedobacter punctiformis TaxID=3004097 RepID=A0ABT4LAD2_9SPHI|nr:M60 family metallopeptidase [Pedobacter sp. HCMS5-2]MCZ4244864.1 M60 family metallopeptidase [Pedobacter sp. HCMS5-2]